MEDLLWMRANGLEAAVLKEAAKGKIIFGICGGYQMLGENFPIRSVWKMAEPCAEWDCFRCIQVLRKKNKNPGERAVLQVKGDLAGLSGIAFSGYEIHMGQSVSDGICRC